MPRDINTLRLLRFRYDGTLAPIPLSDTSMDNILKIPPITKVKVKDVSTSQHSYSTRRNVEQSQDQEEEDEDNLYKSIDIANLVAIDKANHKTLGYLSPRFDVSLLIRGRMMYFTFGPEEITISQNSLRKLTN
ncbi:hypothetical protein L7F22_009769 [Adiantum nelumboides]|nr:hypothetical protein [Adiantum nelumboides]